VIVKLKLDENLAERHRIRLESANHDTDTLWIVEPNRLRIHLDEEE